MGINDNLDITDIVTSLADIVRYIPFMFASKQLIITLFLMSFGTVQYKPTYTWEKAVTSDSMGLNHTTSCSLRFAAENMS